MNQSQVLASRLCLLTLVFSCPWTVSAAQVARPTIVGLNASAVYGDAGAFSVEKAEITEYTDGASIIHVRIVEDLAAAIWALEDYQVDVEVDAESRTYRVITQVLDREGRDDPAGNLAPDNPPDGLYCIRERQGWVRTLDPPQAELTFSTTSVPTLVEQNQLFGFEVVKAFADGPRK